MPGFPRREMIRLVSMLMMLALIGMTMYRFRVVADGAAETERSPAASDPTPSDPAASLSVPELKETRVSGPNDQQPFEWSQAEYQFQAVTDKAPLTAEEMPSYWRLMRWSMTQSFDELWERARKDRYFTHLGQHPEKHRGELIALKVSLRRALKHDPVKNSAGVKDVYEVWGVTNESRTGLYCLVFYDLPPEFTVDPLHPDIHEEADFVGFFHKLFSYEDAMGKTRWAPLLIGRLRWRENPARAALAQQRSNWKQWGVWWLAGSAVIGLGIILWTQRYLASSNPVGLEPAPINHEAIEEWLDSGGEAAAEPDAAATELLESLANPTESPDSGGSAESAVILPIESAKSGTTGELGMPIDQR